MRNVRGQDLGRLRGTQRTEWTGPGKGPCGEGRQVSPDVFTLYLQSPLILIDTKVTPTSLPRNLLILSFTTSDPSGTQVNLVPEVLTGEKETTLLMIRLI